MATRVVYREPREKSFNFEPLILPAVAIGGLVLVAVYKDETVQIIDKLTDALKNLKIYPIDIPIYPIGPSPQPVPDEGGGGGGGGAPPIAGGTIWTSSKWGNGKSRSISSHQQKDPYDSSLYIAAGSGRKGTFPGDGTARLQGDQSRFYLLARNYNSAIFMDARASSGLSNLSLKLRSRHGEGGSCENRFGGYGVAFHFDANDVESKRENCHNIHETIGNCKPGKLNYNQTYNLGMTCQDNGRSVVMGAYINGRRVCQFIDKSPKPYMQNKSSFGNRSYAWIRTNGGGSITLKNVVMKEIGALSASSNLALEYEKQKQRVELSRITVPY